MRKLSLAIWEGLSGLFSVIDSCNTYYNGRRTFPHLAFFNDGQGIGQENLFNVLKAYSLHDPQVGYCQGLPFVVAILLLNASHILVPLPPQDISPMCGSLDA